MTWELVAMLAVVALIFMVVVLFLTAMCSMVTEMRTKRQTELYKAGLLPPGWSVK